MNNEIMVSISCITYNQEDYIEDALKSFLEQKVNFKYEILIHDDNSTDRTVEIIKKYEKNYPDVIKPIYQKTNQYLQGKRITFINNKRAKGKYIAICEGDDFWTDPFKLQKQVEYMENNPATTCCVHAAKVLNTNTWKLTNYVRPSKENRNFSVEEIIKEGGGVFATNSILYRREFETQWPSFFFKAPVGDYPLTIFLALKGDVYYMDEYMSVYRSGAINSWSTVTDNSFEKQKKLAINISKMLDEVDIYTDFKYKEVIKNKKLEYQINILIIEGNLKEIKSKKYETKYNSMSQMKKISIYIRKYVPSLMQLFFVIRCLIKNKFIDKKYTDYN